MAIRLERPWLVLQTCWFHDVGNNLPAFASDFVSYFGEVLTAGCMQQVPEWATESRGYTTHGGLGERHNEAQWLPLQGLEDLLGPLALKLA